MEYYNTTTTTNKIKTNNIYNNINNSLHNLKKMQYCHARYIDVVLYYLQSNIAAASYRKGKSVDSLCFFVVPFIKQTPRRAARPTIVNAPGSKCPPRCPHRPRPRPRAAGRSRAPSRPSAPPRASRSLRSRSSSPWTGGPCHSNVSDRPVPSSAVSCASSAYFETTFSPVYALKK